MTTLLLMQSMFVRYRTSNTTKATSITLSNQQCFFNFANPTNNVLSEMLEVPKMGKDSTELRNAQVCCLVWKMKLSTNLNK